MATLHPAFHPDDSPEIVAAAACLGIPHPPGYPLPTLLGRLAVTALPGAPAFAVNALAAAWACLAVVLAVIALLRALPRPARPSDRLWALTLGVGLATLPQLWFQGASAKGGLYTLNLCLTVGALLCFQPDQGSPAPLRRRRLGWLIAGLAMAGHYMSFVLFMPAFLWWSWSAKPGLRAQMRLASLAVPGVALYLLLPLRAAWHPAMNWGDPSTGARLWQVLVRAQYAGAESGQDLGNALHLGAYFLRLWQEQWHALAWILVALGAWAWWREGGPRWRPWLGCLGLHLAVVLGYNHPPQNAPWVINAFFLPTFVFAAPLMLSGAAGLGRRLGQASPWALALPGAALVAMLALVPARYRANDFHQDMLLYDYGRDLLTLPGRAGAVLAAGGDDAFPVWYSQQVEGHRPDLTLIDVPLIGRWYLDALRARMPELDPAWVTKDQVTQGLLAYPRRPLYYSSHNPGDRGIPLGLLTWVPEPGQAVGLTVAGLLAPWQAVRLRWVADRITPMDPNRAELLAYYPDSAKALVEFAQRQRVQPLDAPAQRLETSLRAATMAP